MVAAVRCWIISFLFFSLFLAMSGCGGSSGGGSANLTAIEISPAATSMAPGTTLQFTATGLFSDNSKRDITTEVAWSSSDSGKATVNGAGLATSLAPGSTIITADLAFKSSTATLTVTTATLNSLEITPSTAAIAKGTTLQFQAFGTFSDGSLQDVTSSALWSSSDNSKASISTAGLATSQADGSTVISAAFGGKTATADLTVTLATLQSIEVTPSIPNIPMGLRQQFSATGIFSDGSLQNLTTSATWSSADTSKATITSSGLATTITSGSTLITAAFGGKTANTTLTVTAAALVSIEVSPIASTIAKGTTLQFTALGKYSDGTVQEITGSAVWASSNKTIATISNATTGKAGLATSLADGSTVISAAFGDKTASANLTVTLAVLQSIEVTPSNTSLPRGLRQQFTATGIFSDGSIQDLTTSAVWSSSAPGVAMISTAGSATTLNPGSTDITAAYGGKSASTTLTVTTATLDSIDVSPIFPTIAKGTTLQFIAAGNYSDGSTQDISSMVIWESTNIQIATISNAAVDSGLATALAIGTTQINAVLGTLSGNTQLTVSGARLLSIAVTPASQTLPIGLTQTYAAVGTYDDGSTQDLTDSAVWSSSAPAVATVSTLSSPRGVATALTTGTTNITATFSGVSSNQATLTVTNSTLVSIAIDPGISDIALKTNQQFTATGTYSDAVIRDITKLVRWSSSNTAVATISNAGNSHGLAIPVSVGTATIGAAYGGKSATATLTVNANTLSLLTVTPINPSIAIGAKQQFKAIGTFGGNTQDITNSVNCSVVRLGLCIVL